jgi:hypothetical protein
MSEPEISAAEPAGEQPIGDAGTVAPEEPAKVETTEPVTGEESESGEGTTSEVGKQEPPTFTDLKTVPDELKPIAKKLQADYTREMQKVAKQRREVEANMAKETTPQEPVASDDEATASMKQFLGTAEGKALKELMRQDLANEMGIPDMRQRVFASEADKEVDAVVAKFGKENIESHYDEIVEVMNQYPYAPLEMIASQVLYGQAKEEGKNEVHQKLQVKQQGSLDRGTTTPAITPDAKITSFEDAFKLAERQSGEQQ